MPPVPQRCFCLMYTRKCCK